MSDAWKTVTIPQKDFGTRSDDWLRGFEAGVAASQKPAADEIERLRAALDSAAVYMQVCPPPAEAGEQLRLELQDRRTKVLAVASAHRR